jgi:hypothetical protein
MRDAIIFLMGASSGGIAGYMFRAFMPYLDDERNIRRNLREINERIEREDRA